MKNDVESLLKKANEAIELVGKLEEGTTLLKDVWLEIGKYGSADISFELWSKVNRFFGVER